MLTYIIKVNIALVILYLAVKLVSGSDTLFAVRRTALLTVIVFALLFPVLYFPVLPGGLSVPGEVAGFDVILDTVTIRPAEGAVQGITAMKAVIYVYLAGVVLLLLRFAVRLAAIVNLRRRSVKARFEGTAIYIPADGGAPFSFCGWIFADPQKYSGEEFRDIMAHELTHVRQGHSLDVLLSELTKIMLWINPVAWVLKADIHRNLEYLADRRVVAGGSDRRKYQYNLLKLTYNEPRPGLTNNFNQSQLKKRIVMMNKRKSRGAGILKYALALPVVMLTLTAFNSHAQEPDKSTATDKTIRIDPASTTGAEKISRLETEDIRSLKVETEGDRKEIVVDVQDPDGKAEKKEFTLNLEGTGHKSIEVEYNKRGDGERMVVYTDSAVRGDEPHIVVEQMPKFQDGNLQTFINWVMSNVTYPKAAKDNNVGGKVIATFIIEKDGKMSTIEILQSPDDLLSLEVINVLLRSPIWTPGKQDGEPVRVKFTLPVDFKPQ